MTLAGLPESLPRSTMLILTVVLGVEEPSEKSSDKGRLLGTFSANTPLITQPVCGARSCSLSR